MTASAALGRRGPSARGGSPGTLLTLLALAATFALSVASVTLRPEGAPVAAWWPAAGVSALVVALSPVRRWPLLAAALVALAFAANLVGDRPPGLALMFGVTNTAESLAVAILLGAHRRRPVLAGFEDLGRLFLAAAGGAAVAGALAGLAVELFDTGSFLVVARAVMATHGASVLIVVPLGLLLATRPAERGAGLARTVERVVQGSAAAVVFVAVFAPAHPYPLAYLPLPLLAWAAARFPGHIACGQMLAAGVAVTVLSDLGRGPFGDLDGPATSLAALQQSYLVILVLVTLPLAIASSQRAAALRVVVGERERYRRGIRESLIGMVLLRHTGGELVVVELNGAAADLLGAPEAELVERPWTRGLAASHRTLLRSAVGSLEAGRSPTWESELWLETSPPRCVRVGLSVVPDAAEGRLVVAQLVDLTAARSSQAELTHERDFSRAVLDSVGSLVVVLDAGGGVLQVNAATESSTGARATSLVGAPATASLVCPDSAAAFEAALAACLAGETGAVHELLWRGRSARREVLTTLALLRHDTGAPLVVMTGLDVTDQRHTAHQLQTVLDATSGAIIVGTDAAGLITFFNRGAQESLGWSAEEVVGRMTKLALHDPEEVAGHARRLGVAPRFEVFTALAQQPDPPELDWTLIRKDGGRLTVSLTVNLLRDACGAVTGLVGVAQDVTERRRSEQALEIALEHERQAVSRLSELDRIKTDFVASISHELRTPMTSVLGFTQVLDSEAAGPLSEEQHALLGRVDRNGRRLLRLIENLLDLSRIESGAISMARERLDVHRVVLSAMEACSELVRARSIELVHDLDTPPAEVVGDFDQLERAVMNLVGNAVKFTPDGGHVTLTVTTVGSEAVIEVSDNGIGIDQADLPRVWDRFYRSASASDAAIEGTGLGLSIVRSIVEAHGGRVDLDSAPRAGTTVRLVLPLACSPSEHGATPQTGRPSATSRPTLSTK
ncbi:ATP-binding protein [Nocardioides sp. P86]|uniref:ATP-binding protein n=1 Tax=Nocardioides sp. P86 TaxID=2939569 RepID=UPI002041F3D4|nr:ATP-binding protein [Nocardioides sp. P86]MCM3517037.1 PAS domain S-box protein [Nocardioides sp. P86]